MGNSEILAKTEMGTNNRSCTSYADMRLAIALLATWSGAQAREGDAEPILRAMSDYVRSQTTNKSEGPDAAGCGWSYHR